MSLFHKTLQWRPNPDEGISRLTVKLFTNESSMLVQSRHDLVVKALKEGCTHVFFLDADMIFPADTLIRLIKRKKEVIGVNATNRAYPCEHIAHDLKSKRIDSRKKRGVQKVQHVGLAVMLIDVEVFKQMDPPLFFMEWIPDLGAYCGEDVFFCAKAQHIGYDIWIDHDLSHEVLHIGSQTFGPGMIGLEAPEPRMK